jgi:hypothetical protein
MAGGAWAQYSKRDLESASPPILMTTFWLCPGVAQPGLTVAKSKDNPFASPSFSTKKILTRLRISSILVLSSFFSPDEWKICG